VIGLVCTPHTQDPEFYSPPPPPGDGLDLSDWEPKDINGASDQRASGALIALAAAAAAAAAAALVW